MDHTWFQVIESRSGPDHTNSACAQKNSSSPHKRGSKRAISTPTRKTPKHEHKRIKLDEKTRHNKWSIEEKSYLKEYSQKLRKYGESENSFWNKCAIAMNNMFGGKNRTGSSSPREVAVHILSSSLRGSIVVELLNEIEYAAKECYSKDSVLAQKDFCDLAEFKWHELIDELLEQQPLLADVLLAVSLPTSKIGNTKSVQRLILVISTVFGMLMNTGYQELSLQLVSSKDNRNDFS
ncbi:hypothetical protein DPMN_010931 [Dreissena polymorpha]|uniref:Uncharacterized protein n=2 Tax=Dreissena polymorpha TaxID=45954 RepID=A0A9D4S1G3_DREPO|nr:hypothetical protein DPMN_010931 [Dreissena polymorpha]